MISPFVKDVVDRKNARHILLISDAVVHVDGLADAIHSEMVPFKDLVFGITLNLRRDECQCWLEIASAQKRAVRHKQRAICCPCQGKVLLGRVIPDIYRLEGNSIGE